MPKAPPALLHRRVRSAFTLLEVVLATVVLAFGISSSIVVLQTGFRALDTARNTTLAAQVIQSEMERIRLLPWDTSSPGKLSVAGATSGIAAQSGYPRVDTAALFPDGAAATRALERFTVTRTITDVPNRSSEIKNITITVTWRGIDGVSHRRVSTTQYAKDGLYDYYYTRAKR